MSKVGCKINLAFWSVSYEYAICDLVGHRILFKTTIHNWRYGWGAITLISYLLVIGGFVVVTGEISTGSDGILLQ